MSHVHTHKFMVSARDIQRAIRLQTGMVMDPRDIYKGLKKINPEQAAMRLMILCAEKLPQRTCVVNAQTLRQARHLFRVELVSQGADLRGMRWHRKFGKMILVSSEILDEPAKAGVLSYHNEFIEPICIDSADSYAQQTTSV